MKKRFLALFLVLCMALGMIPVSAAGNYLSVTLDPNGGTVNKPAMEALTSEDAFGLVSVTVDNAGMITATIDLLKTSWLSLSSISALISKNDGTVLSYWEDEYGSIYESNDSAYLHDDMTLTAQYAEKTTVRICAGGGTFDKEAFIGEELNEDATEATREWFVGAELSLGDYAYTLRLPEGKLLTGWTDELGNVYSKDGYATIHSGMVLTAQLIDGKTILFDAGDGTFDDVPTQQGTLSANRKELRCLAESGLQFYIGSYEFYLIPPEGKLFSGWVDESGSPSNRYWLDVTDDVTLTAQYQDALQVRFCAGAGTFNEWCPADLNEDRTVAYYDSIAGGELELSVLESYLNVPEGKSLAGWMDEAGNTYGRYGSVTVHSGMVFTARYADNVTVTLRSGEGVFDFTWLDYSRATTNDAHTEIYYKSYVGEVLSIQTFYGYNPRSENKSFSGWQDETGYDYSAIGTVTAREGLILTAQYSAPKTVTFQAGEGVTFKSYAGSYGGALSPDRKTLIYTATVGQDFDLSSEISFLDIPAGRAFVCWVDAQGNRYDRESGYWISVTDDLILTAQYEEIIPVVLLSGDGSFDPLRFDFSRSDLDPTHTVATCSSTAGESLWLSGYSYSLIPPDGKSLCSWKDENGSIYDLYDPVIAYRGLTLTAQYAENTTVRILSGDGKFDTQRFEVYEATLVSATEATYPCYVSESLYPDMFSKFLIPPEGKVFCGWKDENGSVYDLYDSVTAQKDMILTAQYAESVQVQILADGGRFDETRLYEAKLNPEGIAAIRESYAGETIYLAVYMDALIPPAGKVFGGWTDENGTAYKKYDTLICRRGLTLHPIWLDPVNITAYANGGTFDECIATEKPGVSLSADRQSITIPCTPGEYHDLDQYSVYLRHPKGRAPVAWIDEGGVVTRDYFAFDGASFYCSWGRPATVTVLLNGGTADPELAYQQLVRLAPDRRSFTVSGCEGATFFLQSYSKYLRSESGKVFAGLVDSNGKRYWEYSDAYILEGETYTALWEDAVPVTIYSGDGVFTDTQAKSRVISKSGRSTIDLYEYAELLSKVEGKDFCGWVDNSGNTYEKDAAVSIKPGLSFTAIYRSGALPKLATPEALSWNRDGDGGPLFGSMYFRCPANKHQGRFEIALYDANTDEQIMKYRYAYAEYCSEMSAESFLVSHTDTAGRYYFTVRALGDGINYDSSDTAKSDVLIYEIPQNMLPKAAKPYWGTGENANRVFFTKPSASYRVGYECQYCYAPTAGIAPSVISRSRLSDKAAPTDELSDAFLMENGCGYYYVRVRYISYEADRIRSGPWSALSDAYVLNTGGISEKLNSLLQELPENPTAQEVIDTVKASVATEAKKEALRTAMLADSGVTGGVSETITALEKQTGIDIMIDKPEDLFVNGAISVVGAALNAREGAESVSLNISKPSEEQEIPEQLLSKTQYQNTVQFVMDLGNAAKDEDGQLAIPVKIKMPIPTGIHPDFLVILHQHHDGKLETINWPQYTIVQEGGVNYVCFVVTDFSTFALAQTPPARIREENGILTAETTENDSQLLLAFYDGNGKMLSCKLGKSTISCALPDEAATAKAFVLEADGSAAPVLPAVPWER